MKPRAVGCRLFNAPADIKLRNFDLPGDELEYYFPWAEGERNGRWWLTLARLNDPVRYAP